MEELSAKETLSLLQQIVNGVTPRNKNDVEGLDSVLAEINHITSRWQNHKKKSTSQSKVMFALNPETSGWASAGIDPTEVKTWELIGFTPELAQKWTKENLTLSHALKWSNVYAFQSFKPHDIAMWEFSGCVVDAHTAKQWLQTSIKTERAIRWVSLGGSYYGGKEWLSAYRDAPVDALYATSQIGLTGAQAKPWIERNIFGEDVATFIRRGYTAAVARKHLDAGGTPADAPDRLGGEPIPGTSWKKIATVIKDNKNITYSVSHSAKTFECEISHSDHDNPVTASFHKNGQFAEAWGQIKMEQKWSSGVHTWYRQKSMKLNELVEFLKNWN